MDKERKILMLGIFLIIISVVLLALSFVNLNKNNLSSNENKSAPNASLEILKNKSVSNTSKNCNVNEKTVEVKGNSLSGLIEEGAKIKVLENYYACNDVKRGDIVLYDYAGSVNPLIKVVKGIPGDKIDLKQNDKSGWNILINGEILKTSKGEPYNIDTRGYKMLNLYIKDYGGEIPQDGYLILGNNPVGTLDSTVFGLVNKDDFIGKVKQ